MSTTPSFEIPPDIRKITEQTVEQVRTAINAYLQFFQRGVPNNLMGGAELTNRIVIHAEHNVASAFAFARKLLEVKDPQGLFMLQIEFIQAQMQAMTEQAKNLSETTTKAMVGGLKSPSEGGLSS